MSKKFLKLDKEVFDIFWPDLSKLFTKVIESQGEGRDSLELLYTKITGNLLEVWICRGDDGGIEAAFCTSITQYPEKRSLFWGYMAAKNNNLSDWKSSLWTTLKNYGNQNTCDCIEYFSNRKGWSKILGENKNVKVKEIGTVYEINL